MHARRMTHALVTAATAGSLLVGCSGAGAGGSSGGGKSINVLMVGNPQMEDIAKLTKSTFTK
ncbi:sugar ABC transporter substrate-binding protein, partial [Streptomyces sp. NPDC002920]